MNEEVMKILKMVEEGKLSADKAKDFIEALDNDKKADEIISVKDYDNKMLKVNIQSHEGDQVNVKLPVKVIKSIMDQQQHRQQVYILRMNYYKRLRTRV